MGLSAVWRAWQEIEGVFSDKRSPLGGSNGSGNLICITCDITHTSISYRKNKISRIIMQKGFEPVEVSRGLSFWEADISRAGQQVLILTYMISAGTRASRNENKHF